MIQLRFEGSDKELLNVPSVRQKLRALVNETALKIEAAAKRSMTTAKHGRTYPVPGQKKNERFVKIYRASAPGEAPATRPGRLGGGLLASIRTKPATGENLTATVGSSLNYAPYLEFGTSRMAARPYLAPPAETLRPEFIDSAKAIFGQL